MFVRITTESGDAFQEAVGTNLSEEGIYVQTPSPFPAGTALNVELSLGGEILSADGVVLWMRPDGMAVRFKAISEAGRERLRRTIVAQQAEPALQPAHRADPPELHPERAQRVEPAVAGPPARIPPPFTPPPPPPASLKGIAPLPVIGKAIATAVDIPNLHPRGRSGEARPSRPLAIPAGTRPPAFDLPRLEGKSSRRMIGIDLGTAFSCAAFVRDGVAEMIPVDKGRRSFPSAVFTRGNEVLVGAAARERSETHPAHVVHSWKRMLGREFGSASVSDALGHLAYEIEPGPKGEAVVRIDDVLYWPRWFAARVLYEIRRSTRDHLGEVVSAAVVTVPAYYTNRQREAVREAATHAGFETVRLLNEPVAAAIAYGVGRSLQKRILVYDLGGGTFDVSVVEVDGNLFQVIATGGDSFLGGVDFDDRVMGHLMVEFLRSENVSLVGDPLALSRLRAAAERAKLELSSVESTRVSIPYLVRRGNENLRMDTVLTRADLESLTLDLVDRTLRACDAVLAQAEMQITEIDEVLLVGGMTRMPLIQRRVESHLGRPARKGTHPDEAIGLGAALFAASLGNRSMAVLDVLSMAVGVEMPAGSFQPVIPPKAALPVEKRLAIHAEHDGQTEFALEIFQGNSVNIGECEYLGTLTLKNLPPAPAGASLCEARFGLDEQGTLSVQQVNTDGTAGAPIALSVDPRATSGSQGGSGRGLGFFRRLLGL